MISAPDNLSQLRSRKQKRSHTIRLGIVGGNGFRFGADMLNVAEFAIGMNAIGEGGPGF